MVRRSVHSRKLRLLVRKSVSPESGAKRSADLDCGADRQIRAAESPLSIHGQFS
jgi:hypothetical protein